VDETALPIEDQAGAATGGETAVPSNLGYFLRMILVLALVLGAIYLVMRLLRRAGRPKAQEDSSLRILASTSVGAGRALHVVSLGASAYLIGATDSSVSLIDKIDDKEFIDALTLRAATEAGAPKGDFAAVLGSLIGKAKGASGKAGRKAGAEGGAGTEYLARQRDRLKKFQP
jgi:flagellar biosynthetic protein FliO